MAINSAKQGAESLDVLGPLPMSPGRRVDIADAIIHLTGNTMAAPPR